MKILLATCILLSPASAYAQTYWDHNGSTVTLEASGSARTFHYHAPRAGLPVASGTLLFRGKRQGGHYSGTAFLFSSKCGARGYTVSGPVSDDQRTVTMYGKAPIRDSQCRVVGHRSDVLVFNLQEEADQPTTAAERKEVILGVTAFGFHPDPCRTGQPNLVVYPPTQDVAEDFQVMIEEAKLHGVEIRESNVARQACAFIERGVRQIVLGQMIPDKQEGDPQEVRGLDIFTLAHEIGHHVCRHEGYTADTARNWRQELQADRYAGMLLAQLFKQNKVTSWNPENAEDFLNVVVDSMAHGAGYRGGSTHPPDEFRRSAVREGFYNGSDC